MKNFKNSEKWDPYEKNIPYQGELFEEDGKTVYWNCANAGDSVEIVMSRDYGDGQKPLDAKKIDTPEGEIVIVKWEDQIKKELLSREQQEVNKERELLEKAIPIILQRGKKYQWPKLEHPGDDGGATQNGYRKARDDFEKFLESLG
ncbi:hypothetical protein KKC67_01010 [Patescibacteria group bacterium]|nr:hypothetical protein [Patescibacteria group bacterium]MBU1783297.1 hypothetical protein [Patescibacteria group bacterium]MBU1991576.1 hypothetical protein [Patescibacteria group bacterium]